jgi:uncharacterized protein (DUF2252 family)
MPGKDVLDFHDWQTPDAARAAGRALRKTASAGDLRQWNLAPARPSILEWMQRSNADRLPDLVPTRNSRMVASPFAFLRGSAALMAADLSGSPVTGIKTQICGDAHASNFGFYGDAEHDELFGINDFDESVVGPWEWDLKRLVTSLVVAGRSLAMQESDLGDVVQTAVTSYATVLASRAAAPWGEAGAIDSYDGMLHDALKPDFADVFAKAKKAASKVNSATMAAKISKAWQFVEIPGIQFLVGKKQGKAVRAALTAYLATVPAERVPVLTRFAIQDVAFRVVGTGSVGRSDWIVLLRGNADEPLILQVKQAGISALADHLPRVPREHQGQRVVRGQRRLQLSSDRLLGWTAVDGQDCYVRQFRDLKGGIDATTLRPSELAGYGRLTGAHLAWAHTFGADPRVLSGYCGHGRTLGKAMVDFALAAADQNEQDHADLQAAMDKGLLAAQKTGPDRQVAVSTGSKRK